MIFASSKFTIKTTTIMMNTYELKFDGSLELEVKDTSFY